MNIDGIWFEDDDGRTLMLRGANLGGSTKVPFTPDGATYRLDNFYDWKDVSFVGRPFPLDEADEHLGRLASWGMTFLRFLTTWEAIEHAGPKQYDGEYLDYVRAVVKKAGDYGIDVFIDPHQDVWSRWTGGDGAPAWTFDAIGIDIRKLHTVGAAITHQTTGDPFPRMIWPANSALYGAATMFTLFFAGNDFAPETFVDGVPVQEYLQSHYIDAIKQVAERLKDLPNVIGYDSLNEPGGGFIGVKDASQLASEFRIGAMPTPYQGMLLASGHPQDVAFFEASFEGMKQTGLRRVNPDGVSLYKPGFECVWRQNGVWALVGGEPQLLRPDHFARKPDGSAIDVGVDYMKPFMKRFIAEIRGVDPRAFLFLEGSPDAHNIPWNAEDGGNAVNAAHWYDIATLLLKSFDPDYSVDYFGDLKPVTGSANVQAMFDRQLAKRKAPEVPTVIGEFGIPFDLDDKAAYRSGDFSAHVTALDMYYDAMDANLLNCTIWNYTADNTNARGDKWNDEDLSIFSRDQQDKDWREDIHAGGRGLLAIVRPYARKTAGEPLRMSFDLSAKRFEFEFRHDPAITEPTVIFVPTYQYPNGVEVELSDGTYTYDPAAQWVLYTPTADRDTHTIVITPKASP